MKNKFYVLTLILVFILGTNVFAYRWVEQNDLWYVLDENKNEYLKDKLLDVGDNVYYINSEGVVVTGWWYNSKSKKYYFFDNNPKRSLGGMVFGLTMIDGYYRYFNDNGTLATSSKKGEYKKVYNEYYADYEGNLYFNNELMRDTSIAKSEYYTNPLYYENDNLNNYYLAKYDSALNLGEYFSAVSVNGVESDMDKVEANAVSGGINYYIDDYGRIKTYGDEFETKPFEKYGPMPVEK